MRFKINLGIFTYAKYFLIPRISANSAAANVIYQMLNDKPMPTNNETGPLQVHVGFYVESMGNFRATEMAFDMDMYLYMSWLDINMKHNQTGHILINGRNFSIFQITRSKVPDKNVLDKIWTPDLYFANARSSYFHEVTVHNFNMYISKEGRISYGTRVTLNLACNLNLKNYPLDSQICYVKIISYAHVQHEMMVRWFPNEPIRYNPDIKPPEFEIKSFDQGYCNGTFHYTLTHNSSRIGNFSCLLGMIRLKREIGFHLVQSYIPTGLIVAISWVSFWIDRRAVPARVSLSFTTLLTLSTQGNGIRYQLPAVSYAKSIDLFFGVCTLFIFGVLLEFALVNSYMRRANKYNHMAEKLQSGYGSKNAICKFFYLKKFHIFQFCFHKFDFFLKNRRPFQK
ncbi:hypothetical protein WR25_08632 isoform D [Diploscapter pachys]|uniref:Uncharacterized protein n=1 Tax=Diploscapter pachys TaxID=2018661 RepID=A0A2A2JUJ4_9BILA|nr:hypothetical protein WR25_08632 isoform B [Diploscapter pachys]PAV65345.1 hypothetical protein WR25_08632 isoform D [Diploscapter pachys]